jgi:hypothetical protein
VYTIYTVHHCVEIHHLNAQTTDAKNVIQYSSSSSLKMIAEQFQFC